MNVSTGFNILRKAICCFQIKMSPSINSPICTLKKKVKGNVLFFTSLLESLTGSLSLRLFADKAEPATLEQYDYSP